jgi:hypothetical protein
MKTRSKLGCLLALAAIGLALPAQAAAKDVTVRKPVAQKFELGSLNTGKSPAVRWSVLRRYGGGSQQLARWVVIRRFGN